MYTRNNTQSYIIKTLVNQDFGHLFSNTSYKSMSNLAYFQFEAKLQTSLLKYQSKGGLHTLN